MKSMYIHIPFCKSICSYCDFCKLLYNLEWSNAYIEELSKEIHSKYEDDIIETLYIGGGTPSSLNILQLQNLFNILKNIKLSDNYEFTFECNLNDINDDFLKILKNNRVNRLSIGIESFNKNKLSFMERNHTYEEAKRIIDLIRYNGFKNVNIDLIYGIPEEKISYLKSDINKILKLNPEHISTYSLIIENHTKIKVNNVMPIDEDIDSKMYDYIIKKLTKNNYNHYEISNFAKTGYESKHNLNYWNNSEYYGFGLGASGYILGLRYDNTRNLNDYLNGDYILNENIISKREDMENEIMLGLRKCNGINLEEFYNKFDINLQEEFDIKSLLKEKNLIYKNGNIFIPKNKLYLMNEILLKIL